MEITKLVGNTTTQNIIGKMLKADIYPKISILHGISGVGKTTQAHNIACILTENNENKIREENLNKKFVANLAEQLDNLFAVSSKTREVIILNEFDLLSFKEQTQFNNYLDKLENSNIYLIMTTNYINKISNSVKDRARCFLFNRLQTSEIKLALQLFAQKEKLEINDELISLISQTSDGTVRSATMLYKDAIVASLSVNEIQFYLNRVSESDIIYLFSLLETDVQKCYDYLIELSTVYSVEKIRQSLENCLLDALIKHHIGKSKINPILRKYSYEVLSNTLASLKDSTSMLMYSILKMIKPSKDVIRKAMSEGNKVKKETKELPPVSEPFSFDKVSLIDLGGDKNDSFKE